MHIIFGESQALVLKEKYTVLELETFRVKDGLIKTFCVVDQIPIEQITKIESMRNLHEQLIENYYKKDWNFCEQAIEHLIGQWGGELNTFYSFISNNVKAYKETDPGESWTGIVDKT